MPDDIPFTTALRSKIEDTHEICLDIRGEVKGVTKSVDDLNSELYGKPGSGKPGLTTRVPMVEKDLTRIVGIFGWFLAAMFAPVLGAIGWAVFKIKGE